MIYNFDTPLEHSYSPPSGTRPFLGLVGGFQPSKLIVNISEAIRTASFTATKDLANFLLNPS